MANILFPKNRKEVADRLSTDVQASLPKSQPFLRRSFLRAIMVGCAGRIYDFYLQLKILILQMFPDTATGDYMKRWGSYVGINPLAATQSTGYIVAVGQAGSLIAANSIASVNSEQYSTMADATVALTSIGVSLSRSGSIVTATSVSSHNLASNITITISGATPTDYNGSFLITVTSDTTFTYNISTTPSTPPTGTILASYTGASIQVVSVDFGSDTDQSSGTALTWQTPINGVDNLAYVQYDGITGGNDSQDTDVGGNYQKRVLFRYQKPHALFNTNEIETTVKSINGVTRAWVQPITPQVGQVTVYFTRDKDANIIPSASQIAIVKAALLSITPATTSPSNVFVLAPTAVPVNFTFTALDPNNSSMQEAIRNSLNLLFREANDVEVNFPEDEYRCSIRQSKDQFGNTVKLFSLSSPTGDITIGSGQIATLGTITFP